MNTKNSLRSAARLFSATLLVGVLALTAFSQGGTSTVRGTVKDPAGNVVAGANVKLTNVTTNATRATTTRSCGPTRRRRSRAGSRTPAIGATPIVTPDGPPSR